MSLRIRGGAGLAALAVFAFALTGSAAAATSTASSAVRGVTATAETGSSTAVAQYWTAERMRSAVPVEPERGRPSIDSRIAVPERGAPGHVNAAAPSALQQTALRISSRLGATAQDWAAWYRPPGSTSGKVFFTGDDGVNRVCSGSTVNSGGKNVVFTAGHCVHGGGAGRRYFTNWAFVPGYRDGARPYGTWSARQLWSLNGWTNSGNRTYDIGAAVMNIDAAGRRIVNVVGGQGIEWNYPLSQFMYQFGYPSRTPFNGERLQLCTGTTYSDGGHQGIQCNMTEGASGGPWLDDFDGTFGRLDSVNSWVFWDSNGNRYKWNGPYFGDGAHNLYNSVANL